MSWQVFDKFPHRYDHWFDTSPGREISKLESWCLKEAFRGVMRPWLEIGVGPGRFAGKLKIDFGVDPSQEMLRKASKRGIKVTRAVAEHLPFPQNFFGGIAIIVTLCFLDEPSKALKECFCVLRKGGSLILGIVPRESRWGRFYLGKGRRGHPFYSAAHFYTVREARDLLERADFELENVFSTLFEDPEEPLQIRPYPPALNWTKKAGFVCLRMRKP